MWVVIVLCASLKLYNLCIIAKIFNKFIENTYTRQLWFVFWRKIRSISIVLIVKWQFLTTKRALFTTLPTFERQCDIFVVNSIYHSKCYFWQQKWIFNEKYHSKCYFNDKCGIQNFASYFEPFRFHKQANYVSLHCV